MVNEESCNTLAITSQLKEDHFEIAKTIEAACIKSGTGFKIIEGAKDYWCRDFMPIQIADKKFVQFVYDPAYYKNKKYCHLKTSICDLAFEIDGNTLFTDIVLDGGNIVSFGNIAIVSDRIFTDNKQYTQADLMDSLTELLSLEDLIIVPALPHDVTGHIDGMIKFINRDSLLINDFRFVTGKTYWIRLLKSLRKFNLILLPNDLHLNEINDDATGDYINMAIAGNVIFMPIFKTPTDLFIHQIISNNFCKSTIVAVHSRELTIKGGSLHCATWTYFN